MNEKSNDLRLPIDNTMENGWEELEKRIEAMEEIKNKRPVFRIVQKEPSTIDQFKVFIRKVKGKIIARISRRLVQDQ